MMACSTSKPTASTTSSNAEAENKEEIVLNDTRDAAEIEKLFWARRDSTTLNYAKADVDFMQGMIAHHSQALIMSSLAKPNNASKSVQTLDARIINAQKDEIAIMQRWLSDRDETVPQVTVDGLNLIITPGKTLRYHLIRNRLFIEHMSKWDTEIITPKTGRKTRRNA